MLIDDLQSRTAELDKSIRALRKTGTEFAQAEMDYKIALRKEALKLKDEKMPSTLINIVVYGDPAVARLRFSRDVKQAVYQANIEAINSTKLQIRIIDAQVSREWSHPMSD